VEQRSFTRFRLFLNGRLFFIHFDFRIQKRQFLHVLTMFLTCRTLFSEHIKTSAMFGRPALRGGCENVTWSH